MGHPTAKHSSGPATVSTRSEITCKVVIRLPGVVARRAFLGDLMRYWVTVDGREWIVDQPDPGAAADFDGPVTVAVNRPVPAPAVTLVTPVPLIVGGSILAMVPHVEGVGLQLVLLVVGSGLCGSIYVVCPPMLGEFTPVQQRGAVIAIYGAIYTLAGILAPSVMGSVIQRAAVPLDGYMMGFTINAVIMIASGLLGLLLLWPNTERARLLAQAAQPKFA